ncbi:MAG: hypothetical protein AAFR33_13870 [Pseudomonadota bacterium]
MASLDGWDDALINGGAAGTNGEGHENIATTPSGVGTFTSTEAIGGANSNWFIYGGSVNGTAITANGSISVTLEDVEPLVLPPLDTSIGQRNEINGSSGNDNVDF